MRREEKPVLLVIGRTLVTRSTTTTIWRKPKASAWKKGEKKRKEGRKEGNKRRANGTTTWERRV